MRELTPTDARNAVIGGGVLACGGGGWKHHGELMGDLATRLNRPVLAGIDELPEDTWVATVAAIGAPASKNWEIRPVDYVHALEELIEQTGKPISAVFTAQNGYSTTLNGWIQSSVLGVTVLDTAGDVRAHPTGKLGSLGLQEREGYETTQVVSGGNRELGGHFLSVNRGRLNTCDDVLRDISIRVGGFIASARNPLEISYVREHAAHGSISLALDLGADMQEAGGGTELVDAVAERLGGEVLATGPLTIEEPVETYGSFDHGAFRVGEYVVPFLNEFMAVTSGEERVASYPDSIIMIDLETSDSVAVKDVGEGGHETALIVVPAGKLPVSTSAIDPTALRECEEILKIPFLEHLDESLRGGTNAYRPAGE